MSELLEMSSGMALRAQACVDFGLAAFRVWSISRACLQFGNVTSRANCDMQAAFDRWGLEMAAL